MALGYLPAILQLTVKCGEHADATLAPLSISIASAYGEAEPRRAASSLLLVGMKHGEVPPWGGCTYSLAQPQGTWLQRQSLPGRAMLR